MSASFLPKENVLVVEMFADIKPPHIKPIHIKKLYSARGPCNLRVSKAKLRIENFTCQQTTNILYWESEKYTFNQISGTAYMHYIQGRRLG